MTRFVIADDELLNSEASFDVICVSDDYWGLIIEEYISNYFNMTCISNNDSLYVRLDESNLQVIIGSYFNASLNSVNFVFEKWINVTLKISNLNPRA